MLHIICFLLIVRVSNVFFLILNSCITGACCVCIHVYFPSTSRKTRCIRDRINKYKQHNDPKGDRTTKTEHARYRRCYTHASHNLRKCLKRSKTTDVGRKGCSYQYKSLLSDNFCHSHLVSDMKNIVLSGLWTVELNLVMTPVYLPWSFILRMPEEGRVREGTQREKSRLLIYISSNMDSSSWEGSAQKWS